MYCSYYKTCLFVCENMHYTLRQITYCCTRKLYFLSMLPVDCSSKGLSANAFLIRNAFSNYKTPLRFVSFHISKSNFNLTFITEACGILCFGLQSTNYIVRSLLNAIIRPTIEAGIKRGRSEIQQHWISKANLVTDRFYAILSLF